MTSLEVAIHALTTIANASSSDASRGVAERALLDIEKLERAHQVALRQSLERYEYSEDYFSNGHQEPVCYDPGL